MPPLTIKTSAADVASASSASASRRPSLVLKVPTPSASASQSAAEDEAGPSSAPAAKRKKESKKQRRARVAGEIYESMVRIKAALDRFRDGCLFCQQTCYVSVDTVFLLTHLSIVHNQASTTGKNVFIVFIPV